MQLFSFLPVSTLHLLSLSLLFFPSLKMLVTFSSLSICIREKKSNNLCSTNLSLTSFIKLCQYRNPTNANPPYLLTAYADRSFQWLSISSPPNPPKIVWESHFQAAPPLHINPSCCHISTLILTYLSSLFIYLCLDMTNWNLILCGLQDFNILLLSLSFILML